MPEPLFAPVDGFCNPGSSWTLDCNKCSCMENRAVPACTLQACPEGECRMWTEFTYYLLLS